MDYSKYIGQYVKRFYNPLEAKNIYKIKDFRKGDRFPDGEFLYSEGEHPDWWADVEDSVIITNEQPIISDQRVLNIHDENYIGYNPFANSTTTIKTNTNA